MVSPEFDHFQNFLPRDKINQAKGCEGLPNREWHPVFVTAVKEALADAGPGQVEIQAEVALSSKPLNIDVIVIKKHEEAFLSHPIAGIFRKYNLFEFKSPLDYLAANDFDKGLALARQIGRAHV